MTHSNLYITMPKAEYDALVAENQRLRALTKQSLPDLDDCALLMSPRLYVSLKNAGITNVAEIAEHEAGYFTAVRGLGRKTYSQLQELMTYYGIHFKED